MNDQSPVHRSPHVVDDISALAGKYDRVALVLQGGGALGA